MFSKSFKIILSYLRISFCLYFLPNFKFRRKYSFIGNKNIKSQSNFCITIVILWWIAHKCWKLYIRYTLPISFFCLYEHYVPNFACSKSVTGLNHYWTHIFWYPTHRNRIALKLTIKNPINEARTYFIEYIRCFCTYSNI